MGVKFSLMEEYPDYAFLTMMIAIAIIPELT